MRGHTITRIRKRREERYAMACEIELRMGSWFSIRVETQNISRGGTCVRLPGGARFGERYQIIIAPSAPDSFDLTAEVRWVGDPDAAGFASVGMKWLAADAGTAARLAMLLK